LAAARVLKSSPGKQVVMKTSHSIARQSLAVIAMLALAPALSVAEFQLLEMEGATSRVAEAPWSVGVEFRANAQRARSIELPRFPYTIAVTDEVTGEVRVVEGERPEPDLLAERTVILTPRLLAAEELKSRVHVTEWLDGSPATDADAEDAVVVRPFGLGTALTGVEIIARPGRVRDANGEARTAGRMEIELQGPADVRGRVEVDARAMQDPLVQRVLATSVLNADAVRAGRSTQTLARRDVALPEPPGDYRLTYSGGDEMFIVYPDQIGIQDATALGALVLDHHGVSIPWRQMPDGGILFYAPRRVTDSDNNDSVFARLDAGAESTPMRTRAAFTTIAPPQNPGQATERGIQRSKYKRLSSFHREYLTTLPLGQRFVSPRVSRLSTNTLVTSIPIWDIPTNSYLHLKVVTHGDSAIEGYSPDHVAGLSVNGTQLIHVDWEGFTRVAKIVDWTSAIPVGSPLDSVQVTYQVPTTAPAGYPPFPAGDTFQHVESLEVTYLGKPRVDDDYATTVRVVAGDQGRISVGGFPAGTLASQIAILDVTNPHDPEWLLNPVVFPDETGGSAVHFQSPIAGRTYRVQYLGTTGAPEIVEPSHRLPDTMELEVPLRAIYVRDAAYAQALAPLVAHRGAGVVEITPQAAYDAFNGGQQSVDALRQALQVLIARAPESSTFPSVVLFGYGTLDHREVSGQVLHPQIPGSVVASPPVASAGGPGGMRIGENMVDYPYSTLFGDDDYPDVRLGRVPVRGPADVARFVNRLLAHEGLFAGAAGISRPLVLTAGVGQPPEPSDRFINTHRDFVEPIWDDTPFEKRVVEYQEPTVGSHNFEAFRDAVEAGNGASLIFYLGHGNVTLWGSGNAPFIRSGVLAPNIPYHVTYINTRNKWPITINFTCASGRFMNVNRDEISQYSIAETMLHYVNPDFGVPGGVLPNEARDDLGSVAAIMPVGFEYAEPMIFMELEFTDQVAGNNAVGLHRPLFLGDEWLATQVEYLDGVVSLFPEYASSLKEFILFGDPDTLTTLVGTLTDVGVGALAMPGKARPGDEVTIRVVASATEIGDEARGVVAEVALPAELEFVGASAPYGSVEENFGLVTWQAGSLLPGVELAMDVTVRVAADAELPLEALVTLTSITQDVDPSDNGVSVIIGPAPDVVDSLGIY
jgi:hypothetical protein